MSSISLVVHRRTNGTFAVHEFSDAKNERIGEPFDTYEEAEAYLAVLAATLGLTTYRYDGSVKKGELRATNHPLTLKMVKAG